MEFDDGMNCPIRKQVVASLEGMRVTVTGPIGELEAYNFVKNVWVHLETANLPIPLSRVDRWLTGWNGVDRLTAVSLLLGPLEGEKETIYH